MHLFVYVWPWLRKNSRSSSGHMLHMIRYCKFSTFPEYHHYCTGHPGRSCLITTSLSCIWTARKVLTIKPAHDRWEYFFICSRVASDSAHRRAVQEARWAWCPCGGAWRDAVCRKRYALQGRDSRSLILACEVSSMLRCLAERQLCFFRSRGILHNSYLLNKTERVGWYKNRCK